MGLLVDFRVVCGVEEVVGVVGVEGGELVGDVGELVLGDDAGGDDGHVLIV